MDKEWQEIKYDKELRLNEKDLLEGMRKICESFNKEWEHKGE